jgi:hypothetical protein
MVWMRPPATRTSTRSFGSRSRAPRIGSGQAGSVPKPGKVARWSRLTVSWNTVM